MKIKVYVCYRDYSDSDGPVEMEFVTIYKKDVKNWKRRGISSYSKKVFEYEIEIPTDY